MDYIIPKYEGVTNVQFNFDTYFKQLLNKCQSLFKFKNLPSTIDENYLKCTLLLKGAVCFGKVNDKLYVFSGNVGGEPNCYYKSTEFIVANPILGSHTFKIRNLNGDNSIENLTGIYVGLTSLDQESYFSNGYFNLLYQTAGLLADNISSLNVAQINSRVSVTFTADSETLANSAEEVLQDIYSGKPYRVLSQDILNKIQVSPVAASGANNTIMSLIEAQAHIYQNFYNEIGIGYNGNLKRERINSSETNLMQDSLDLNIYNTIECLKKGIELVNEKFNTNISVELNYEVNTDSNIEQDEINDNELQIDGVSEDSIKQEEVNDNNTNDKEKEEDSE